MRGTGGMENRQTPLSSAQGPGGLAGVRQTLHAAAELLLIVPAPHRHPAARAPPFNAPFTEPIECTLSPMHRPLQHCPLINPFNAP